MTDPGKACFHCGEPLPDESPISATVAGAKRYFCCYGCRAVSDIIRNEGLEQFYQQREAPAVTPEPLDERVREECLNYDSELLQSEVVQQREDGLSETWLMVEGLTCAACIWLIERHLEKVPGLESISINHSTQRAHLVWDPDTTSLGQLLLGIRELGFSAAPFRPGEWENRIKAEQKRAMIRIGIAGIASFQTMMLAYPLQFGLTAGTDTAMIQLFRWASLLIATPVVLYSALPFFSGALRDLKQRHPGMDVPVSIAIAGGYLASTWVTLFGGEHVYFESICMFTFFLGLGRFLEARARYRAGLASVSLINAMPGTALRIEADGDHVVPSRSLSPGDVIRVRPGDTLAADGTVVNGQSAIDESMLTGEYLPVSRHPGDAVSAGTLNTESPLEVRVDKAGNETRLSAITRLLDRAQEEKPATAVAADRVATWFVTGVLIAAALTFIAWSLIEPERAFAIALAVLVATCPCALSLATPTALTVATSALREKGFLPTRGTTLEALSTVDTLVFDKTGTLTQGRLNITGVQLLGDLDETQCQQLAAGLETGSEHPIARAFSGIAAKPFSQLTNTPGEGLTGTLEGKRYAVGSEPFVQRTLGLDRAVAESDDGQLGIYLARDDGWLARITLNDQPRADARETLADLRRMGYRVIMLSGDQSAQVTETAHALGLDEWQGRCSPEGKLAFIRSLEEQGHKVMMVGDGLNDLPVLAGARLSVAVAGASDIARLRADAILLGESLHPLRTALTMAPATRRVIRQNLGLSLLYNITILPLAMAGLIVPWLAAAGMSASSVMVVMNALRLGRMKHHGNPLHPDTTHADPAWHRRARADLGGTQ
ncbi:Cu2+-exporting ATPase [Halospina denitrificans]|uniref:Cu2+-exporting ATPase n=1 Tax=Halospina denitrificans TaxID=332522 RepID=A0A4R7JNH6_9GAMM|nr:heavy metal translocating P-type ATPase [Halospina denitrificans]TDT39395.1 Cu2+-exporting ATPase [Halospina denitrificans]